MITASSYIKIQTLPPTCAATKSHSFRVYLQVQQWVGNDKLQAKLWGWKEVNSLLLPVTTDLKAAPDVLLASIRCGCKTGCKSKARCSCKRNGFHCHPACTECKGQIFSNTDPIDNEYRLFENLLEPSSYNQNETMNANGRHNQAHILLR